MKMNFEDFHSKKDYAYRNTRRNSTENLIYSFYFNFNSSEECSTRNLSEWKLEISFSGCAMELDLEHYLTYKFPTVVNARFFYVSVEDLERHDGTPEKPYYMSKELMKILGKKNKKLPTAEDGEGKGKKQK
jgi:hypothetical protein